jgi:hypothetical protein
LCQTHPIHVLSVDLHSEKDGTQDAGSFLGCLCGWSY